MSDRFVTFRLQGGLFAIPAAMIERIFDAPATTPLPGAPATVFGIAPHEGRLLALLDTARLLGLPAEAGPGTALALTAPHQGLGLVVPAPAEVEVGEKLAEGEADVLVTSGPARLLAVQGLIETLTKLVVTGLGSGKAQRPDENG
jgi:hypothetical protein